MEVLASTGARKTQLRMVVCLFIASPYLKNALPILRIYTLFIGVYSTDVVSSYIASCARAVLHCARCNYVLCWAPERRVASVGVALV